MRLIHCADLHLDSPMESNLPADKARERKMELRSAFSGLVRYASENGVEGILIAGDLFDSTHVTGSTEKYVWELIASHPEVRFFYLAGNHDRGGAIKAREAIPENLFLFDDGWRSYRIGNVVITGSERPDPATLSLSPTDVNILMLHGQERAGKGASKEDVIHLGKFKNKHIDYMALGHLHEYRTAQVDRRCTACYSGCLEGRGFDECGPKGYVMLEISERGISHSFVPVSSRVLHTVECDITESSSQLALEERILSAVEGIPSRDLVKVVLRGSCPPDAHRDTLHLRTLLSERFYFVKIKDECRLRIRAEDYRNDISLKGEFVRRVMASALPEEEKERVITCGFRALSGEEIGL